MFGDDLVDAADVVVEQLYEPVASASAGIWRVSAGRRSVVLKLVAHSESGHVNWRSGEAPTHWYYWRREVFAYESGLLGDLTGGLRAPHCYLRGAARRRQRGPLARGPPGRAGHTLGRRALRGRSPAPRPDPGRVPGRPCAPRRDLVEPRLAAVVPLPSARATITSSTMRRRGATTASRHGSRRPRSTEPGRCATTSPCSSPPSNGSRRPSVTSTSTRRTCLPTGTAPPPRSTGRSSGSAPSARTRATSCPTPCSTSTWPPTGSTTSTRRSRWGTPPASGTAGWYGDDSLVRLGMAATIATKYAWILPTILPRRRRTS